MAEGPVIPDIIGTLVPKIPATRQSIIAPQMPAPAPKPVATPNANACGSAIIAEFIPPNKSPVKIFSLNLILSLIIMVQFYHKYSLCYNFVIGERL